MKARAEFDAAQKPNEPTRQFDRLSQLFEPAGQPKALRFPHAHEKNAICLVVYAGGINRRRC